MGELNSHTGAVQFESPYLASAFPLAEGAPRAHGLALAVHGRFRQEALRARLVADPNPEDLAEASASLSHRRLPSRVYEVALTRLRAPTLAGGGRTVFAVTGADLPDGMTLVLHPHGDRVYLKHDESLAPMHLAGTTTGV
ncbi:MAG: hypothetical protein U0441_31305 [Polyangiaceae bacterium]